MHSSPPLPAPALPLVHSLRKRTSGVSPADNGKVALKLFGRSNEDLLNLARCHHAAMEGNDSFPQPRPSQEALAADIQSFEDDCAEVERLRSMLKEAMARRETGRQRLTHTLDMRGCYVQATSRGNAQKILSAGMGVQRKACKVTSLPAPTDVRVVPGVSAGEVVLTWGRVPHALLYYLEYGPEGGEMEQMSLSGRRKRVLNLPVQVTVPYVFRIAAVGSPGRSNFSAPVKCYAR